MKRKLSIITLAFNLLFLFCNSNTIAQVTDLDNWKVKDGLPQNTVQQLIQTTDGYIWIGTDGGLARFDGVKFTLFDSNNTPELYNNRIRLLYENKSGCLIISSYNSGIVFYRNNHFFRIKETLQNSDKYSKVSSLTANKIYEDKKGMLFFFLDNILLLVVDGRDYSISHEYDAILYRNIQSVIEVGNSLHFIIADKVYKWEHKLVQLQNEINANDITYSFDEKHNCGWLVTQGKIQKLKGFAVIKEVKFDDQKVVRKSPKNKVFVKNLPNYIYVTYSDAKIFFRFNKNTEKIETHEFKFDNSNGVLTAVLPDKEGNLWYGTSTGGLFKDKPKHFSYLDKPNELKSYNFYPITKTPDNRILIGSHTDAFYEFDALGKLIPRKFDINYRYINALEYFNDAIYFCDNSRQSIKKLKDRKITEIKFPIQNTATTSAIYKTKSNQLLIGNNNRIYELIDDQLMPYKASKLGQFQNISTFYEDSKKNLWIATDTKIFCYNPAVETLKSYSTKKNNFLHFYRGLHEDRQGRIFCGSYGNGLTMIENERVYNISINNGLAENVVSTITEDKKGNFWFTGNKGLSRVKKQDVLAVLKNKNKKLNVILYNEANDNLRTGEFNGGIQQAKCKIGAGKYLFPSVDGCVIVDFSTFKINDKVPPVHIENLVFGDSLIQFKPKIALPYKEQRLILNYTALSFVSPKNVRFKYILEGYDNKWIDGGHDRSAFYNKIPPGNYIFKVIASNNEGVWNKVGASMEIAIIPPFYMTLWFKTLLIILAFAITIFSIVGILNKTKKRQLEKSALMDILPDLVLKLNKDGYYLDIYGNPDTSAAPPKNLRKKNINEFFNDEISKLILQNIDKAITTKTIQIFNYNLKLSDNRIHYFEGRIVAKDREEVLFIVRDVTDTTENQLKIVEKDKQLFQSIEKEKNLLEQINEQQQQQLAAIIETEEKERSRIATDLHDGIGQLLSSVKMNLTVVDEQSLQWQDIKSSDLISKTKDTIDQMTNEIRSIAYNLLPPSLEHFGLASAIEEEVKKLQFNKNQSVQFIASLKNQKLNPKTEIILYRSFQEIVNNALKHSKATEITIQLIQHDNKIVMMIEDNGKGFNFTEGFQKKNSLGLKNIYSRVNLINGKIKVDSNSLSGTSITIEVII